MPNILSIENAKNWSWGISSGPLRAELERHDFRFVRFVRRAHQEIEPDLIDFFDLTLVQNADNIGLINRQKRKVVTRMGGMVITEKEKPTRYDHWLAQVGAVISTNKQLHAISSHVSDRAFLVPNAVDLERFRLKPTELCWPYRKKQESHQPFTVGFAGNIWGMGGEYKGWQYYVEAVIDLMLDGVEKLECLHNGPANQRQLPHDKMCEEFYWKIDALILPSVNEGCSNVTGEALACGVPVLCTQVGYHGDELVDGGNVIFIERSREDIVAKVRRLKEDDELYWRISRNGRKFVENNQNVEKIAQQYDEVFRLVLRNARH